ncbi:MAG TPA: DNA polymerase III subunit gamma/tau, partial [Acidiphilium sp.]
IRKVPVTVLSRCQRFDLKRVPVEILSAHFAKVAAQEAIPVEPAALEAIARAADGSVRDGLSLLDQAIARGADEGETITGALVADMLGLADRGFVFDLIEAVAAGKPVEALGVMDRAHERGADPVLLMQDLLGLAHTLSRLKALPALARGSALPELERTRGAALAERLSVPWLGRLWQMLLKGISEAEQATDRRAAADMILIRLCFVADLPPPGDLVRRLSADGAQPPAMQSQAMRPDPGSNPGPGAGARAVVNGAPLADAVSDAAPRLLRFEELSRFEDVVALAGAKRDVWLSAHLRHDVRLVRFAPPVIELNLLPAAPRDLAARLAAFLEAETGRRWTIALSRETGVPSIAEAEEAALDAARADALADPLVQAIFAAFPGAKVASVSCEEMQAETEVQTEAGAPQEAGGEDIPARLAEMPPMDDEAFDIGDDADDEMDPETDR